MIDKSLLGQHIFLRWGRHGGIHMTFYKNINGKSYLSGCPSRIRGVRLFLGRFFEDPKDVEKIEQWVKKGTVSIRELARITYRKNFSSGERK